MTRSLSYAVYVMIYTQAAHLFTSSELSRLIELAGRCRHLPPVERAIAEFAMNDATNGTPMRSRDGFEQSLQHGAAALRCLGLRDSPHREEA